MVEQLIRNEQVGGSIPFTSSMTAKGHPVGCPFAVTEDGGNRTRKTNIRIEFFAHDRPTMHIIGS